MQPVAVSVHILDRPQGHAALKRRLRHRRRDLHHEARVEGLGNQIFRAKSQLFAGIGSGNHFALLGLREFGNGMHGRNFHLQRNRGCPRIERTAKNVREAQHIVNLVRIVRTPRGHDRIAAHRPDFFGQNFRCRIGQRKNKRLGGH